MKILIVSDSHGRHENLELAIEREMPDAIYHLGDGEGCEDYIEAFAECPLEIVRGNCDFASDLPAEIVATVGAHRILLTHGHYYNVAYGTTMLVEAAKEKSASAVIYGHTHIPELTEEDGITILNPGSISFPRQENRMPTYAVLECDQEERLCFSIVELG